MSHEEAANAIQGIFDAYNFNGPDQATWIDELASLSQGWPQHINSVAVAAGQIIWDHGGSLQSDLLPQALELGKEKKEQYYSSRLKACSEDLWIYKELALVARERGGVLGRPEISKLTRETCDEKGLSVDEFIINALYAVVLMESKDIVKHYVIPIPSFGEYLKKLPIETSSEMNN